MRSNESTSQPQRTYVHYWWSQLPKHRLDVWLSTTDQCRVDNVYDSFQTNGFSQCVTESTRGNKILDVVCTNEAILVSHTDVLAPFASGDMIASISTWPSATTLMMTSLSTTKNHRNATYGQMATTTRWETICANLIGHTYSQSISLPTTSVQLSVVTSMQQSTCLYPPSEYASVVESMYENFHDTFASSCRANWPCG